jgi:two-component system response regulator AdeR
VAMLTGVDPSFDITDMGFDDYVRKPVDEAALFDCVEGLLARQNYDTGLQEFYSIARRIALLRTEHDREELVDHDGYQRLLDRRAAIRDRLDGTLDRLPDDESYALALDEPTPPPRGSSGEHRADGD